MLPATSNTVCLSVCMRKTYLPIVNFLNFFRFFFLFQLFENKISNFSKQNFFFQKKQIIKISGNKIKKKMNMKRKRKEGRKGSECGICQSAMVNHQSQVVDLENFFFVKKLPQRKQFYHRWQSVHPSSQISSILKQQYLLCSTFIFNLRINFNFIVLFLVWKRIFADLFNNLLFLFCHKNDSISKFLWYFHYFILIYISVTEVVVVVVVAEIAWVTFYR